MSEGMQIRISRPSRVERTATSCSECRRRKQRCNQGQPCSNCSRRFPQPPCEYTPSTHRRLAGPDPQPAFSLSTIPAAPGEDDKTVDNAGAQQRPLLQVGQVASEWVDLDLDPGVAQLWRERMCSGFDVGELVRWTGIDILTQFPGPSAWEALPWMTPGPSATNNSLCISRRAAHPQMAKETAAMMQLHSAVPDRLLGGNWNQGRTEEIVSWLMTLDTSARLGAPTSQPSGDSAHQDMSLLPVPATKQNAELLRTFVKFISRFKAAIDGNPDPDKNQYVKFYVPFAIQTPLLAQVAIYTASCFLNETGHVDMATTMSHKGRAIRMLNELLRSSQPSSSTSDEAVTAVIQLILDEWYWGETSDLRAHLRGLREMIRLRGGIRCLGMNGLLGKLAIVADVAIALSAEVPPFLGRGDEFEYREAAHVPFRVAYNTPLVSPLVPFADCADALDVDPVTASILDDMRFLISRVLGMPADPSAAELRKLGKLAAWMLERISKLPAYSPGSTGSAEDGGDDEAGLAEETKDWLLGGSPVSERGQQQLHAELGGSARARTPAIKHESPEADRSPHGSPESTHQDCKAEAATESTATAPTEPPDYMYEPVRQAALLYCRAVASRRPFSAVVAGRSLSSLWEATWGVSLARWRAVLGVFGWILLPMVSSSRGSPHDQLVKSMVNIWGVQMGLDNWDIAGRALQSALRLQEWLGGSGGDGNIATATAAAAAPRVEVGAMSEVAEVKRHVGSGSNGAAAGGGLSPGAGAEGRAISPWLT